MVTTVDVTVWVTRYTRIVVPPVSGVAGAGLTLSRLLRWMADPCSIWPTVPAVVVTRLVCPSCTTHTVTVTTGAGATGAAAGAAVVVVAGLPGSAGEAAA